MITDQPFRKVEVAFTVEGEPATKSRARVVRRGGRTIAYTPQATKDAEAHVRAAFLQEVGRLAPSSLAGFGVEATFRMASGIRRDVDNMLKVILDGLNKVAWGDDYQVTEVTGRKVAVPAGEAGTDVRIYVTGMLQERTARCQHCDETFPRPPSHGAKKFCSDACRRAARQKSIAKTCPTCGVRFQAHSEARGIYCSKHCHDEAGRMDATCVRCGQSFRKPKHLNRKGNSYCSSECKAGFWREQRKGAAKGTCSDCGGPTSKKSYQRCRDCSIAARGAWANKREAS